MFWNLRREGNISLAALTLAAKVLTSTVEPIFQILLRDCMLQLLKLWLLAIEPRNLQNSQIENLQNPSPKNFKTHPKVSKHKLNV